MMAGYEKYLTTFIEGIQKSKNSYVLYVNDVNSQKGFNETIGAIAEELAKEFDARYDSSVRKFQDIDEFGGVDVTFSFKPVGEEAETLMSWADKNMAQLKSKVPGRDENEVITNLAVYELSEYDVVREIDQLNYWWKDLEYNLDGQFVSRGNDFVIVKVFLVYDKTLPSKESQNE